MEETISRDSQNPIDGRDLVLGYALPRDISVIARAAAKSAGVKFSVTRLLTDLLAFPCVLLVCDFSRLSKHDLAAQYKSMLRSMRRIPTSSGSCRQSDRESSEKPSRATHRYQAVRRAKHKLTILAQLRTVRGTRRKAHDYDKRLRRLLSSLKQLRTQEIVKARDCAQSLM